MTRIVDLSLPVVAEMPRFPDTPPVFMAESQTIDSAGYRISMVVTGSHSGTHLDAPSHFLPDGYDVGEIPLEACLGEALVVDFSAKGSREPIRADELERAAGDLEPGGRLLVRTDWDERFGEPGYFDDFPPLSPETADWLVERRVVLVGIDMPTLHQTAFAEMHRKLLATGMVIVESLANLRELERPRVTFSALPVKFVDLDGAPVRAVAWS